MSNHNKSDKPLEWGTAARLASPDISRACTVLELQAEWDRLEADRVRIQKRLDRALPVMALMFALVLALQVAAVLLGTESRTRSVEPKGQATADTDIRIPDRLPSPRP